MTIRNSLALIAAAACLAAAPAPRPSSSLVGRWQYIQPPDKEGEVLDLFVSDGRLRGIMNGLERAGEHGLFYYVVEVDSLEVAPDERVSFEVGDRTFFSKRPALSSLGGEGDAGAARDRMRFQGKPEGAELVLRCEGPAGACPDSLLRFSRIPATRARDQPADAPPDSVRDRRR